MMKVIKPIDLRNIDQKRILKILHLTLVPRHMKRIDVAFSIGEKCIV